MSDLSPLSGVKRKLDFGAVRSAFDPKETLAFCVLGWTAKNKKGPRADQKQKYLVQEHLNELI